MAAPGLYFAVKLTAALQAHAIRHFTKRNQSTRCFNWKYTQYSFFNLYINSGHRPNATELRWYVSVSMITPKT
ncbi:uncharacterized protein PgNI_08632 [Pyricularia grisea]|uniref:Uncharacterized protein n=1 Tax=Pyricularia grisea TaxID=148305 RepID=A0A6P8AWN3_PYRGI|nr:uncharacterized protein PgNI_08632 [Pyricularia grisea]TLD06641.1 hypothetical protein PgNI_08632 [Pyricularia grisea]